MTTMIESCVSLLHADMLSETLKFGLPVIVVSPVQRAKHDWLSVEFCPKPSGSVSDVNDGEF